MSPRRRVRGRFFSRGGGSIFRNRLRRMKSTINQGHLDVWF
ncbi:MULTISPECIES: hypothetical protein [Paenibacillus]|uniref:Uncharacterized protein n=1 Tax=Paenibacillus lactis TaxID=228574 RepID=A0ABS4F8Z4_9BACL|nr:MULTISPECIES: hypothetical protein [Paenibacillus]MBP1892547.1 hypothetical protein [Paenibacillus lactis]